MKTGISASMMCTDFIDMKKDIRAMENAGIEYLHFDIMDGSFVPNYALGVCMIEQVRRETNLPLDIHLMVERPELKTGYFPFREGDTVSVHAESTVHLQRLLQSLRREGIHPGVAMNPATPVEVLEYVLDVADFVLVMTVNPGFAGQVIVEETLRKIENVRSYLDERGYRDTVIQVDGNVSFENARKMKAAGAGNFVAGSAGLFRTDMTIPEAAKKLREAIR